MHGALCSSKGGTPVSPPPASTPHPHRSPCWPIAWLHSGTQHSAVICKVNSSPVLLHGSECWPRWLLLPPSENLLLLVSGRARIPTHDVLDFKASDSDSLAILTLSPDGLPNSWGRGCSHLVQDPQEWKLVICAQMSGNHSALVLASVFPSIPWNFSLTRALPQPCPLPAHTPSP